MNTYTVTVRPNADAFAAILRFDPDAWIELETAAEDAETYTISSVYALDALLDAALGLIEWDDVVAVPMISVLGSNKTYDLCTFFFDSLTGEPVYLQREVDFGEPVIEQLTPADVPDDVAAEVQRYLAATTVGETGLYGLLLRLDRKIGRFTIATRIMWRMWNWYVARGAQ